VIAKKFYGENLYQELLCTAVAADHKGIIKTTIFFFYIMATVFKLITSFIVHDYCVIVIFDLKFSFFLFRSLSISAKFLNIQQNLFMKTHSFVIDKII